MLPPLPFNLRKTTYHTRKEVENGLALRYNEEENDDDATTYSGDGTADQFDSDDEGEFNPNEDDDDVMEDIFIDSE